MCVGLASVGFRCGMAMQRRRCVTRTVAPALGIVQGDMRPDVPVRGGGSRTRRGVALTYAQDASIICRRHSPRRGSCIWTPVIDDIMVLVVFRQVWRWRRRAQAMDVCDATRSVLRQCMRGPTKYPALAPVPVAVRASDDPDPRPTRNRRAATVFLYPDLFFPVALSRCRAVTALARMWPMYPPPHVGTPG